MGFSKKNKMYVKVHTAKENQEKEINVKHRKECNIKWANTCSASIAGQCQFIFI